VAANWQNTAARRGGTTGVSGCTPMRPPVSYANDIAQGYTPNPNTPPNDRSTRRTSPEANHCTSMTARCSAIAACSGDSARVGVLDPCRDDNAASANASDLRSGPRPPGCTDRPLGSASRSFRTSPDQQEHVPPGREGNPGSVEPPGHPARQPGHRHTPGLKSPSRNQAARPPAAAINPCERSGLALSHHRQGVSVKNAQARSLIRDRTFVTLWAGQG
jgi:hypothetical protein